MGDFPAMFDDRRNIPSGTQFPQFEKNPPFFLRPRVCRAVAFVMPFPMRSAILRRSNPGDGTVLLQFQVFLGRSSAKSRRNMEKKKHQLKNI